MKAQNDGTAILVRRLQAMSDAMPGVRSLSVLDAQGRAIASNREVLAVRPDIPVRMATGNIRPEDEARAREAGIQELLAKPLTIGELGAALERLSQMT